MSLSRRAAKTLLARGLEGAAPLLSRARRAVHGPEVRVLGFHRVVDDLAALGDEVIPSLCISTRSFARLVERAASRYPVLPLAEAVDALSGRRPLAHDALVITFDDAYRDVVLRALPILERLDLPATVFVPTGHVDTDRPLLHDHLFALLVRARREHTDLAAAPAPKLLRVPIARAEAALFSDGESGPLAALELLIDALPAAALSRIASALEDLVGAPRTPDPGARVMSSLELNACARGGLSLGAHTVDHVVLTHESPARVRRELARPKRDLERLTGEECVAFAYCNGLHSPALREAVRRAGYHVAVTTHDAPNRLGQEPLALGRKVMWEGHVRGPIGYSPSLAAAHVDDLFRVVGDRTSHDGAAGR